MVSGLWGHSLAMADRRKSDPESGWLLPAVVDPERIGVCVPVPNDDNHRRAFLGCLYELTWARNWQHDGTDKGLLVSQVWKEIYFQVQADLHNVACGDPYQPCITFPNTASFIEYGPNDPRYELPGEVPDCYASPPWYYATTASNLAYGSQDGDIICTFERLPIPPGPPFFGCFSPLYPWIKIHVSGTGQVELHLRNVILGSGFLVTRSDDPLYIMYADTNRDVIQVPPETEPDIILEFDFTEEGDHWIQLTLSPNFDVEEIPIVFGGGIVNVVLCGFDQEAQVDCCDDILAAIAALELQTTYVQNTLRFTVFDGTPTSINPMSPTGTYTGAYPDNLESRDTGLCMALATFVFSSVDASRKAAAAALGVAVGAAQIGVILGPLGWIVGAVGVIAAGVGYAALDAAIQNEDALRDIICQLYDALSGATLDQSTLQNAVDALDTSGGTDWETIKSTLQLQAALPTVMNWLYDLLGTGYAHAEAGQSYDECGACDDLWKVVFNFVDAQDQLSTEWQAVMVPASGWTTIYVAGEGFRSDPEQTLPAGAFCRGINYPGPIDYTVHKWRVDASDTTLVRFGYSNNDDDPPLQDDGPPNVVNDWLYSVTGSAQIRIRIFTASGGSDKTIHRLTIWGSGTNPWEGLS